MTPAGTAGNPCGCRACPACADAAVLNGAAWSDPFGTGRATPDPKLIVRKLPPATTPGLFDEQTNSKGK